MSNCALTLECNLHTTTDCYNWDTHLSNSCILGACRLHSARGLPRASVLRLGRATGAPVPACLAH
eukprot:7283605-Pyramimonas_sp.AAC.1